MTKRKPISAEHTAKVLLINLARYKGDKGKDLSRFRITRKALRSASNRQALREAFVLDVIDEMAELGWSCIDVGTMATEGELAFIQSDKIEVWPRLGIARMISLLRTPGEKERVQSAIDKEYEIYFPEEEEEFEYEE